jgi:uncharacterized protein YgfB (UPF0149 family)
MGSAVETSDLPVLTDVSAAIAQRQLGVDASELHGSLCGYLSAGGMATPGDWLLRLGLVETDAGGAQGDAVDHLFLSSLSQLDDPALGFTLLLPADEQPVTERAEALLSWCRGFLGGFGLASGPTPPLSPEAGEALDDLGKIAASSLSYDDPVGDEAALVEIEEFVRVAALLLHGDCVGAPRARRLH